VKDPRSGKGKPTDERRTPAGSRKGVEGWRRTRCEGRQRGRALRTHGKVRHEGGGGFGGDGGWLGMTAAAALATTVVGWGEGQRGHGAGGVDAEHRSPEEVDWGRGSEDTAPVEWTPSTAALRK